ncbi:MAG: hypothetical protein RL701_2283 [Pseudomonadota bacterium]
MSLLEYRAGIEALHLLRTRELGPKAVSALLLPAIGPKWLVLAGFDRGLIEAGWFDTNAAQRLLLFGASVGAWRALTLAARDPLRAHAALLEAYITQRFTTADSPAAISGAYRRLLETVFEQADLAHAAQHPRLDLAIATVRAVGPFASERRGFQALALTAAALLNAIDPRVAALCLQRCVFATTGHVPGGYPLLQAAGGVHALLTESNMREVALASGTVPMYMQLVRNLEGAQPGAYLDGGFSDYHLNRTADAGPGVTLLFSHQRRIVPAWFDKFAPWRKLDPQALSRLVLVYPSEAFVKSLPGGAIPTRDDFKRFVQEPELRIERWRTIAERSRELAATFLADAASGAIASKAKALE